MSPRPFVLSIVIVASVAIAEAEPKGGDQPDVLVPDVLMPDVLMPDVLMIVVDDMNDWITLLDDEAPIQTPQLKRLASRGTLFTKAYCISPACNPSRVATLLGQRPSTTGVYGNKSDWRRAVPHRPTIMQCFRSAGYDVRGAGKIFHHHYDGAFHDDRSFDDFQPMRAQRYPIEKLNAAPEYGSRNTDWGEWPPTVDDSIDFGTANYVIEQLTRDDRDRPMFLACGIFKPHSPFFAPEEFHNEYSAIALPARNATDWVDLPTGAKTLLRKKQWFWTGMMQLNERRSGSYRAFVRSYAAAATFADQQIGRVLDALERSPRGDQTIVVLWSDHGFHLGEKDHIEKFSLWEKANHIPFIIAAPSVTEPGSICDAPIDLTALYPTLLELAGLQPAPRCDGESVVDLLKDSDASEDARALMTYGRGNHAVRSARWRYIRYADGSEELYDHAVDPHEWTNLAGQTELSDVIDEHRQLLPKVEAKPVADLKKP